MNSFQKQSVWLSAMGEYNGLEYGTDSCEYQRIEGLCGFRWIQITTLYVCVTWQG